MRVCFVHQNLPAQFRHLISALLARGDQVLAVCDQRAAGRWPLRHPGLAVGAYRLADAALQAPVPAHLREMSLQTARADAVLKAMREAEALGLKPDLVVAHPGWGESMYLRGVLPDTPLLAYCEMYYHARGADLDFDPEFPADAERWQQLRLRNLPLLLALHDMDAGWCPTAWQHAQFPAEYRPRMQVLHEGVDTARVRPDPKAECTVGGHRLRHGDPIVTYVARNLEPYRGFHVFMRSLPLLQRLLPQVRVVVVGGDAVSYGRQMPPGDSHRQRLMAELGDRVDWGRVVFTGVLPYGDYLRVLQVSAVHAYLSVPFVLSWSMLEAMASGCCLVASSTPPVREVVEDGVNGKLVDFVDPDALARQLAWAIQHPHETRPLREAARRTVLERYDLQAQCLPAGLAMLDRVAGR